MTTISEVCIRQALMDAEDKGLRYNGDLGAHQEPCIYWVVGDYIITHITDDEEFEASMLTEDDIADLTMDKM